MKNTVTFIAILISYSSYGQIFDYYGPAPFGEIMENSLNQSWTPTSISNITNREYVVLLDADTKSQVVSLSASDISEIGLITLDDMHGSASTYGSLMRSVFQLVDIATHDENNSSAGSGPYVPLDGDYKMVPFMHRYYGFNAADDAGLISTDAGTYFVADKSVNGYVLINFNGTSSATTIEAISQWQWNATSSEFEEVANWASKWLTIDQENLTWSDSQDNSTSFMLADATDLLNIVIEEGSDYNPESIEYQLNATAAIPDEVHDIDNSKLITELPNKVSDASAAQLGTSSEATTAASEMLDAIEAKLTDNDAAMRYPKAFYLAIRESMLSQIITNEDIYGGQIGYNTIPDVYFTNATDASGIPHPFMVLTAHAVSTRPNLLLDVNRPPGESGGGGYAESKITRDGKLGDFVLKVPIKDYGLIDNVEENDLTEYGSLVEDYDAIHGTTTTKNVFNYVATASVGVAIDGVTIYPAFNNNLRFATEDAEITSSGIHVGGGLELHYHADGHAYTGNAINLYNYNDFEGKDHPPIIGIGHDGIALFGKYEANYPNMIGKDTQLDEYGGHDHGDGFGYHYHAFTATVDSDKGNPFQEHYLIVGAWKGNINNIPGFLSVKMNQFDDDDIARYAGADYDESITEEVVTTVGGLSDIMSIYPNPSDGIFQISIAESFELSIYNIDGKMMKKLKIDQNTKSISLQDLASGVYIIHGKNAHEQFQYKVIIE